MKIAELSEKKPKFDESSDINSFTQRSLVLHNDDHHTFEYVINALIEICNHKEEQAVQCTYIVHFNGKCEVKKGLYSNLKPMKEGLASRGLNVTIE